MTYKIAPSILSANFSRLADDIKEIAESADWLHIDIMDGHFVPNLTIGPPVVKALRTVSDLFFDVHLMIDNPESFINDFAEAGADLICVHAESTSHLHRLLQTIKGLGKKAGAAINPGTPLEMVLPVLNDTDLVLLMTVNPGFGGQSFIETVVPKIKRLKQIVDQEGFNLDIQVDGGITPKILPRVIEAGANVFVAGSAIFHQPSPPAAIAEMREIIKRKGEKL